MGFWKSLFGPSKDEIWRKVAADIGANFADGGFWRPDALRYQVGPWIITLDTYTISSGGSSQVYTRMRAPFVNKDGIYFHVCRSGLFTPIGKLFGMQDIAIGDPFFDESFVIKGNNEGKLKQLLADPKLKQLMQAQPAISFRVWDDEGWFGAKFPEGVDELRFECCGVIKDEYVLKSLFDMFSITLQRLVQLDSAYPNDPNVNL